MNRLRSIIAAANGFLEGLTASSRTAWQARQRRRALLRIRAAYAVLGIDVGRLDDNQLQHVVIDAMLVPIPDKDKRYTFKVAFDDGALQVRYYEILRSGRTKHAFGPVAFDRRGAVVHGRLLLDFASRVHNVTSPAARGPH